MCISYQLKAIFSKLKAITKLKKHTNLFIQIDDEIWLRTVQYQMKKSINLFDLEELQAQIYDLNETMIETDQYLVHHTLLKLNWLGLYENYNLILYNIKNLQNGNPQNILDVNRKHKPNYIQFA